MNRDPTRDTHSPKCPHCKQPIPWNVSGGANLVYCPYCGKKMTVGAV